MAFYAVGYNILQLEKNFSPGHLLPSLLIDNQQINLLALGTKMPSGKRQRRKPQKLTFDSMVSYLRSTMADFPDKRTGKNSHYSIEDAALGAFSVFFTQSPSFLSFQETMLKNRGKSNAQTLFEMNQIPCDNHIRDLNGRGRTS